MVGPNILLLGFTVPDAVARRIFALDTTPAVQTHKFAWSFARALQVASRELVLVSACPIQNYPLGRQLLFRTSWFEEHGIKGMLLGFLNLLVLKHLSRFLGCILRIPPLLARNRVNWIFVHGVHTPFLLFSVLTRLFGRKVVVVLTDPPGVQLPTDSFAARILKRVDSWLLELLLRHTDGAIALAPELINRYARGKPSLVFPGILDSSFVAQIHRCATENRSGQPFTIVYSGGLSEAYGVDRLLEAVAGMKQSAIRLKLFGRGDQETRIRELAATDSRIIYGGFVGNERLVPELRSADLLINPRPTGRDFAAMSFPSKLIEYLAVGRPTLTTRIPSLPEAYRQHYFFIDDETAEGIQRAIMSVMALGSSVREARASQGQAFIGSDASETAIGLKISGLIQTISSAK